MYRNILCFVAIWGLLDSNVRAQTLGDDVVTLATAVSRFSQKLYQELAINTPVAIFSPFSAHTALSMAYLGARGKTAEEMTSVLHLSSLPDPHDAYKRLLLNIKSVEDVAILSANGIWVNPTFTLREEYQSILASKYEAIAESFDFSAPGGPTFPINQWVANKTRNTITDLLKPTDIDRSTQAVLINALYFNGTWESEFEKRLTEKEIFQINERKSVPVNFMKQINDLDLKVSATENVDVLRLPFVNNRFAFYIALPKTTTGLSAFEEKIVEEDFDLNALFTGFTRREVFLTMPKFKLTATMGLNKNLINLGMSTAFSDEADFSGMSTDRTHISDVRQRVEIEVEERGVVAAAATVVRFLESAIGPTPDSYIFRADHPFMYFLRDDETGLILFQGKQTNPTETEVTVD